MDISCDIIRDLLPLYAEDLASEDTRALVDGHLCRCDGCTKALAELIKKPPLAVELNPEPLKKVKTMIRRRRVFSVLAAVLTLLTLASFVITFLFAPFQLTKEQALDDFYVREDGAIVIDYSNAVIGRSRFGTEENRMFLEYSTRYDMWKGAHRDPIEKVFGTDGTITEEERLRYEDIEIIYGKFESADGMIHADGPIPGEENGGTIVEWESEKNWWYSDPTGLGNDTLLHDAGQPYPAKEERIHFAPIYPILVFGGTAVAFVLLFLRKIAKKPWQMELVSRVLTVCVSGVLSTVFVSSGRIFTSYVGVIDQYWGWMIPVNTVLLTLTLLTWRQLYLLNRQDQTQ